MGLEGDEVAARLTLPFPPAGGLEGKLFWGIGGGGGPPLPGIGGGGGGGGGGIVAMRRRDYLAFDSNDSLSSFLCSDCQMLVLMRLLQSIAYGRGCVNVES